MTHFEIWILHVHFL